MSEAPSIVILSVDLMDRSKLSAAFPDATLVRSMRALREAANEDMVVVVDLGRIDDPAELADVPGRVIAYGSHVDEAALEAAEAAGAEALPRSRFFRRIGDGSLI